MSCREASPYNTPHDPLQIPKENKQGTLMERSIKTIPPAPNAISCSGCIECACIVVLVVSMLLFPLGGGVLELWKSNRKLTNGYSWNQLIPFL